MMISKLGISFSKGPFSGSMLVFVGCKTEAQLIMALHTFCLEPYAIWEAHSGLSISNKAPTGAHLMEALNRSSYPDFLTPQNSKCVL